jgi:hypothetical protein
MPKVTFNQPIAQFTGKVTDPTTNTGIVIFPNPKAGNVVRQYVIPTNPKSTQQQMIRGHFAAAAAAYKLLSTAEAAAWNTLAALFSQNNILGTAYKLSGISLYCRVNTFRQLDGQAISDTAPDFADLPVPATGITSLTITGATLACVLDCTGMADGALVFMRITSSIARESRLLRKTELRIASSTETEAFATVATDAATFGATVDIVSLTATQFCGVEFTAMSATYLPRPAQFFNQELISAP